MEYDVLGNERHEAICKLREMPKLYPNKDGGADLYAWKAALAEAIGADTELFSAIRDRLIHLLGGDQPTLSELFGILREDDDGVDLRPSDAASDDSPVHDSAGCGCGGTCNHDGETELAPITTELRDNMRIYGRFSIDDGKQHVELDVETFDQLCDAIDVIHAGLEHDVEMWRDRAEDMRMERDDAMQGRHRYPDIRDADHVPICIGDVMDFTKNVRGLTVLGIGIVDASESSLGVFVREGHDYVWYNAEFLHHHAQTVEDVLREFVARLIERGELTNGAAQTIAEYAARLRLVGDAE